MQIDARPDAVVYRRLNNSSIPALDGIRALCATLVILHHIGGPWETGVHGVEAFFVLSGFLITWLLLKENERSGTISLRNFYIRRALRILPAFYVFWFSYVALSVFVHREHEWGGYLSSFFYFSNYYEAIHGSDHMPMRHVWSLGVEEQFYLLWPWLFFRFKDDLRKLTRLLAGFIVVIWIYRLLLYNYFHAPYNWVYGAFDCRADHLAIGCLLAVLMRRRVGSKLVSALTANPLAPVITLAAIVTSMKLFAVYGRPYEFNVAFILDPLLIATLIAQWIATSDHYLWSWLNTRTLRYLGTISYAAYLYHWIVCWGVNRAMPNFPFVGRVIIAIALSNMVASASYYIVERRFLRLKKRFQAHTMKLQSASRMAAV